MISYYPKHIKTCIRIVKFKRSCVKMIKIFGTYVSLYIGRFVPRDDGISKELPAKITKAAKATY